MACPLRGWAWGRLIASLLEHLIELGAQQIREAGAAGREVSARGSEGEEQRDRRSEGVGGCAGIVSVRKLGSLAPKFFVYVRVQRGPPPPPQYLSLLFSYSLASRAQVSPQVRGVTPLEWVIGFAWEVAFLDVGGQP